MRINGKEVKLPIAFKKKWVKALRSGKYKQGTDGYLHYDKDDTYCCLGVACIIQGVEPCNIGASSFIYKDIAATAKKKIPGEITGSGHAFSLAGKLSSYNDEGKSFKWIASYIERYL